MAFKDPDARRAYDRDYYAAHRDHFRIYRQTRAAANQESTRAYWRAQYNVHKDKINASRRASHARHPEEQNTYHQIWRTTHQNSVQFSKRKFYKAHKNKIRDYSRAYGRLHPEIHQARNHQYRARKIGNLSTATAAHATAIKAAYQYKCAYCGKKANNLTIDHVIPLAKGGTHTPENLVPACRTCNSAKQHRVAVSLPPKRLMF